MSADALRRTDESRRAVSVTFRSVVEERPGPGIRELFDASWPAYRRWFLRDGEEARPTYSECVRALRTFVPELVPAYERLVEACGGGDLEARFLSQWHPPSFFAACSMATVTTNGSPALVRNYDYVPALCETTLLTSSFSGRRTSVMTDCLWGALDGVNEDGLAVALSFGGRRAVGRGFAITLLLRYLLDHCRDVADALEAAHAVPVNLAYNVAMVDRSGAAALVHLAPDREPVVFHGASYAANRQGATEWHEHAVMSETVAREARLAGALADPELTREGLERVFLEEPVYRPLARHTWGTVYTASYDAAGAAVRLLWPDDAWEIELAAPTEGTRTRETVFTLPPLLERNREIPHVPQVIFA
jgi:predicted choloylglycine hydrolase